MNSLRQRNGSEYAEGYKERQRAILLALDLRWPYGVETGDLVDYLGDDDFTGREVAAKLSSLRSLGLVAGESGVWFVTSQGHEAIDLLVGDRRAR